MTIKLEVGKKYELNNGEVHECTEMYGDDPLAVDHLGYGPFVIGGILYHQDGRWADYDAEDALSVKRCVDGVKPEPVAETVALEGGCYSGVWRLSKSGFIGDHTHRITFDMIDGEPDCDSIKMEKLP